MASFNRVSSGVLSALAAAALTLGPVILIRGGTDTLLWRWQEVTFYVISIMSSGISSVLGFRLSAGEKELKRQRVMVWGAFAFYFLYVACAALCQRLGVGTVPTDLWRVAGVVVLCLGGALRLWAIAALGPLHSALVALQPGHKLITSGPYRWVRHPSYLGALVFLCGIPMVFGTWFPLIAIPGCFVAVKWRIMDEEAFLISEFGEQYEGYRKSIWRLIPGVY